MKEKLPRQIYMISSSNTTKIYIGQSSDGYKRFQSHKHRSQAKNPEQVIHHAMKNHDVNSFSIMIIKNCNGFDESNAYEKYYIQLFNSLAPNGYNIEKGGNVDKVNESTKEKLAIINQKFTFEEVKQIREDYNINKLTKDQLSIKYKLNKRSLYDLLHNKTYYDCNYKPIDYKLRAKLATAILTIEIINNIRYDYNQLKLTQIELIEKYKIKEFTIKNIVNNKIFIDNNYIVPNYKARLGPDSIVLDLDIVNKIRDEYLNSKILFTDLANKYLISQRSLRQIIYNKIYIDNNYNPSENFRKLKAQRNTSLELEKNIVNEYINTNSLIKDLSKKYNLNKRNINTILTRNRDLISCDIIKSKRKLSKLKFSDIQISEIRNIFATTSINKSDLAKKYSTNTRTIFDIIKNIKYYNVNYIPPKILRRG